MMLKLFLTLFITLLFQACQVEEKVAAANQVLPNNFPGAELTTVLPADGWKKLGDDIDVALLFPLPINVTGTPYIEAQFSTGTRRFYFYSGDNTSTLVFRYTVTAADLDIDGIVFDSAVELNGGSLTYAPNTSVTQNVPTTLTIPDSVIKVDGIPPYLSQVTAPVAGNYSSYQHLKYTLAYSEKVFVSGTPSFGVVLTSGTVSANYKSGTGTANLLFTRVLLPADTDVDGFTTGTVLNLNSLAGITITDQAGNTTSPVMYATPSTSVLINVTQPAVTLVTPPAATTYTQGQTLDFVVTYSQAVNIVGTPSIPIMLNTGTVLATYLSGTGTNTVTFRYTVQTNHVDTDGITLKSPMLLNGGSIKNLAGTQNAALIYTIPATAGLLVDAATGPYVVSTFSAANGMYIEGQNIDFTLNFNGIVNVDETGGVARIPIIVGSSTVYAEYESGSGTSALVFRYTVQVGEDDLDGISLSGPIELTGTATMLDPSSKPAILSYVTPNTTGILVDGTSPTVLSASWTGSGNLVAGNHLYLSVTFSEVVEPTGAAPTLPIDIGGSPYNAILISGSGTNTLNFRYTIQTGDVDTNGVTINSPLVGVIEDLRNHVASNVFAPVLTTVTVDAAPSSIISVIPPANDSYKIGENLDFTVNWSEANYISGVPTLDFLIGATTVHATYNVALSTPTAFVFRYTVKAGDLGAGTMSGFQLNGGSIRDAAGNPSDLTFVHPNLALVSVDGVIPAVNSITAPANGYYGVGQSIDFVLNWSENITVTGIPTLSLTIGTTVVSAAFVSATATTTTFSYTVLSGELDTNGISMLSAVFLGAGISIQDTAGNIPGNDAYLQLNPPDLTGVFVDGVTPTISAFSSPANGTYLYGQDLDFTVTWSEAVTIANFPRIGIRVGSSQYYATYIPADSTPTTSVFRYTVGLDHNDANGITITSNVLDGLGNVLNSYIELNGGSIVDVANNAADTNFNTQNLTGVLVDGITAVVDPITPVSTPTAGTYGPDSDNPTGDEISIVVNWNKVVYVDTTGGTPYINILVGATTYQALYDSGDGTQNLTFKYTVVAGDEDTDGIQVLGPVELDGGTIQYTYTPPFPFAPTNYDVDLTVNPADITFASVLVDGVKPLVTSITSGNATDVTRPDIFYPGEIVEYTVEFDETITAVATPRIELSIGGVTRYANLYNYTGATDTLTFRYTVDAADALLDLDGITVDTSMDLTALVDFIQDAAYNEYAGALSFSETDYVYFSNTIARYNATDYTGLPCTSFVGSCISSLIDMTRNGNDLLPAPGMDGPEYAVGFGGNSTPYMQFNNSSVLQTTTNMDVKYIAFVIRTVSDASNVVSISNHNLLRRYFGGTLSSAIEFTSTNLVKEILMTPAQKYKINGSAFGAYVTSASTGALWAADTEYIMIFEVNAETAFNIGSAFGGLDFNGQIAEIILLSGDSVLSEAQLNMMNTQLNAIHDVY